MWTKLFLVFIAVFVLAIIAYFGSSILNPSKTPGQKPELSDYLNNYIVPSAKNLVEKTKNFIAGGLALTESPNLPFETAKNEITDDIETKISSATEIIAKNIDSLEKSAKKKMIENVVKQMLGKLSPEDKKIAEETICQSLK